MCRFFCLNFINVIVVGMCQTLSKIVYFENNVGLMLATWDISK
jgi:hypothetical protein